MRRIGIVFFLSFLGLCSTNWLASRLNDAEARGKHIYFHGTSARGTPITATLGDDANPVSASLFACVNCHGRGRGTPEGGVVPADIRWPILTKPYELTLPTGRKRGPYTERSLRRAITRGFDPSNNALGSGMPHFQMSKGDVDDLIAYLKVLAADSDPGVTDEVVRIGVILPPRRMTEMHDAVNSVLSGFFDEINRQGGIFRRKLELHFLDYPEMPSGGMGIVRDFLVKNEIFALGGSFIAGDEAELTSIFQQTETPVVAAFALYPQLAGPLNPYVFYLDEGASGQVKALAAFAASKFHTATGQTAVVYSDTGPSRRLADGFEQQCEELSLPRPTRILLSAEGAVTDDALGRIFQAGNDFVLWLAPPLALLNLLQRVGETKSHTVFLIPGFFAQNDILNAPAFMNNRIFLAYSASQHDLSETAAVEYKRLVGPNYPAANVVSEQWSALASASIVVEALKRSGHDLTREGFLSSLESLSNFDSGFAPPVSYGPNQRAGNTRIQVMRIDLKNKRFVTEDDN